MMSAYSAFIKTIIVLGFLLSTATSAFSSQQSETISRGWIAYDAGFYEQALSIWKPLAIDGNAEAQLILGIVYEEDRGISPDLVESTYWFRQAALQGIAEAQHRLGMHYKKGRGVEADRQQADYWLNKAAEQKSLDALHAKTKSQGKDTQHSTTTEPVPQPAKNSNAFISAGTAWPIASGYVVTNSHVVAGTAQISLINTNGDEMKASVILRDEVHNLALLSVSDFKKLPPALRLAKVPARSGTRVISVAKPNKDAKNRTPIFADGTISSIKGFENVPDSFQISTHTRPGDTGGPLLNMEGEVVGIVVAMLRATNSSIAASNSNKVQLMDHINYAINVDVLKKMLPNLPRQDAVLQELADAQGSPAELADRIQGSVLIVRVH